MPYGCLLYTKRKQSQAIMRGLFKYSNKGQLKTQNVQKTLKKQGCYSHHNRFRPKK